MMRFELIQDIENAKKWWLYFSPNISLYDTWDFCFLFYKHLNHEIYFYVGFENDTPIGLFPLQKNCENNEFYFFGGSYMENNQVYIKPGFEECRKEFYNAIAHTVHLEYIVGEDMATKALPIMDEKYILPLHDMNSLEDYFQKYFLGETRGKMRRKIRHVESEGVTVIKNKWEDIEYLFQFNMENFGERSTFHLDGRKDSFRELLFLANDVHLLSFYCGDTIAGVSLGIIGVDSTYEYLNLGVSSSAPKDMRSYIHLKNIETAMHASSRVFNAGCSDCGWKELFHLQKSPQYKFDKSV